MARLSSVSSRHHPRARRWDVVVLGSALPGLVAAARMAMARLRVLVVEETNVSDGFVGLREPFLLAGAARGVLSVLLRELTVPLIDRRRMQPDPIAFQLVTPDARIDVGDPARTAEELVHWGLAEPKRAASLVRALVQAGEAELEAMLAAPIVRAGGRVGRRAARGAAHGRGLPDEAVRADPPLDACLAVQAQALARLAESIPAPEARARLLGGALDGGAAFPSSEHSIRGVLRQRILALHGDFRRVGAPFELVAFEGLPTVAPSETRELWVGRALVLNAPMASLASALGRWQNDVPGFLHDEPSIRHRTVRQVLRVPAAVRPEGMAARVIALPEAPGGPEAESATSRPGRAPLAPLADHVRLAAYPVPGGEGDIDLVASSLARDDPGGILEAEKRIEQTLAGLIPFAEGRCRPRERLRAEWDDEDAVLDPAEGVGWPGGVEIRVSARPRVYGLPRQAIGSLGFEGELLLGWRAGDAISHELARPGGLG